MRLRGPVRRVWGALVAPSSALTDSADRERSRALSALLAVLIACGALSGLVQLAFIADFLVTFRPMAAALCGIAVAYALSRTRSYRLGAALTAVLVIAACVVVRVGNPRDHVWYAFMMIAVLISATFLPVLWAAAIAALALAATALGFALSTGFAAVDEWLPAIMLHLVLSPLILALSQQRARVEARRTEQLKERDLRLAELQHLETLGRLAAGVGHDFNNLLCVVSCNTQQLLHERVFSEGAIIEISDAAERAGRLVQQLLTFTRKQESAPRPIDPNRVIADLHGILARIAGHCIELRYDCAAALPHVKMDTVQLERVVINLVANARDAMPDGGLVTISTSSRAAEVGPDGVVLRVRDSGVGVDADIRSLIFEPFFTTKRDTGGTGLGLAIVHGIVLQAGGTIEVESEVGRGTTFEITLPGTRPDDECLADSAPASDGQSELLQT